MGFGGPFIRGGGRCQKKQNLRYAGDWEGWNGTWLGRARWENKTKKRGDGPCVENSGEVAKKPLYSSRTGLCSIRGGGQSQAWKPKNFLAKIIPTAKGGAQNFVAPPTSATAAVSGEWVRDETAFLGHSCFGQGSARFNKRRAFRAQFPPNLLATAVNVFVDGR